MAHRAGRRPSQGEEGETRTLVQPLLEGIETSRVFAVLAPLANFPPPWAFPLAPESCRGSCKAIPRVLLSPLRSLAKSQASAS